jgi:CRP-like cAMP-binding protein
MSLLASFCKNDVRPVDSLFGRLRAAYTALVCGSARERFADALVTFASGIGDRVPGGIELDVTSEELANVANVTLFSASRLLSELQREGMLVKCRGKILLRSPERLL